jgi:hypothetical protein
MSESKPQPRPKLSLRLGSKSPEQKETDATTLLTQAIKQHLGVRWIYNRTLMRAAPQLLYRKNESLYCDAVVIERDGAAPAETKLGSFNLAGLSGLALTEQVYPAWPDIDRNDARYQGGILAPVSD